MRCVEFYRNYLVTLFYVIFYKSNNSVVDLVPRIYAKPGVTMKYSIILANEYFSNVKSLHYIVFLNIHAVMNTLCHYRYSKEFIDNNYVMDKNGQYCISETMVALANIEHDLYELGELIRHNYNRKLPLSTAIELNYHLNNILSYTNMDELTESADYVHELLDYIEVF